MMHAPESLRPDSPAGSMCAVHQLGKPILPAQSLLEGIQLSTVHVHVSNVGLTCISIGAEYECCQDRKSSHIY